MDILRLLVDYGVIGLLFFLSFISVGTTIERYFFIRHVNIEKYTNRQDLEIELTKNMYWIATIASNAPYIGLLGTVLGIMLTFYTIGQEGFVDTKKVMVGLALALKATAVGLLVAIPSTALYNLLIRKVREKLAMWEKLYGR
jgi:biopolymer transport protein ExbB